MYCFNKSSKSENFFFSIVKQLLRDGNMIAETVESRRFVPKAYSTTRAYEDNRIMWSTPFLWEKMNLLPEKLVFKDVPNQSTKSTGNELFNLCVDKVKRFFAGVFCLKHQNKKNCLQQKIKTLKRFLMNAKSAKLAFNFLLFYLRNKTHQLRCLLQMAHLALQKK